MNNDKMREEFEDWWTENMNVEVMDLHKTNYAFTSEDNQQYMCHETNRAWFAWKASRESLCIELPSSYNSDGDPWFAGYNCALEDIVDILKETGVNYK